MLTNSFCGRRDKQGQSRCRIKGLAVLPIADMDFQGLGTT